MPDHPGVAGRIFTALAEANINVDMIIQDEPDVRGRRRPHMSFTVPRTDLREARAALEPVAAEVGIRDDLATTPRWARSRSSARA